MATGILQQQSGTAPFRWLRDRLLAERERWVLWLPVALAAGIGTYFGLPVEPPVYLGGVGLVLAAILLLAAGLAGLGIARRRPAG